MRFVNLVLKDFELLKDSGISQLNVDFTSDVQLIIGSNGCGKSTTLSQLSPYPASRSIFSKNGYKSQTIEKDGVYYKLDSEYSRPSSPHLFFTGDDPENINVGRTTDTQKELIVNLLGITPLVDDLIMNRYTFPKWTPAQRKDFVTNHNPSDIGFVLVELKKISSKLRSCKANLSRLQTRKILLEQDLLSEEIMTDLLNEKSVIDNELSSFQKYLMDIELGLRIIPNTENIPDQNFIKMIGVMKASRYTLSRLSEVPRDSNDRSIYRDKLVGSIASYEQQLLSTEDRIITLNELLMDMESQYKELIPNDDISKLDETISRLERARDKLIISKPNFELSQAELLSKYDEWDTVKNKLALFDDCNIPLYSRRKRNHRESFLENIKYRKYNLSMKLHDLRSKYTTLTNRSTISPSSIPISLCSKEKCPLYSHFMSEHENTEEQRNIVLNDIVKLENKEKRIDFLINELTTYFEVSKHYHDTIQWLITYAQTNPILYDILRQMDILTILKNNPNLITNRLRDEYGHIDQWIKLKLITDDLNTAYTLKKRHMSSENTDTVKLVMSIESTKSTLYELRESIKDISSKKSLCIKTLSDVELYETIKTTVVKIQNHYHILTTFLSDSHEKDKLQFIKTNIESIRSDRFVRLSDIERTIRSQELLKSRYTEEVIKELERIEKEISDLENIEKALILIPKESNVCFLNDIFRQANRIINKVWTIPLQIELLDVNDPLTYEVNVLGDNQTSRELSKCSEGQTEILSLAINLALRICLNHLDIPLCLDEVSRTMDDTHRQNLIFTLKELIDNKVISQLFLISHHAIFHESFSDTETLVIRDDNVLLPEVFNRHVFIT